jgi:hypothetical protein
LHGQALNKLTSPQDVRFSDAVLIVTPGITIKDRLRVLMPNDTGNYYRQRDLLPPGPMEELGRAKPVLMGEDGKEAEKRNEEARIWISGIGVVKAKLGVKVIYDLSATPFFLRGSGWPAGTLFPWVVHQCHRSRASSRFLACRSRTTL